MKTVSKFLATGILEIFLLLSTGMWPSFQQGLKILNSSQDQSSHEPKTPQAFQSQQWKQQLQEICDGSLVSIPMTSIDVDWNTVSQCGNWSKQQQNWTTIKTGASTRSLRQTLMMESNKLWFEQQQWLMTQRRLLLSLSM